MSHPKLHKNWINVSKSNPIHKPPQGEFFKHSHKDKGAALGAAPGLQLWLVICTRRVPDGMERVRPGSVYSLKEKKGPGATHQHKPEYRPVKSGLA